MLCLSVFFVQRDKVRYILKRKKKILISNLRKFVDHYFGAMIDCSWQLFHTILVFFSPFSFQKRENKRKRKKEIRSCANLIGVV